MTGIVIEAGGHRLWSCAGDGPVLDLERVVTDIIGEAFAANVRIVAIPLARLPANFLDLRARLAGEVLQKFVNYGLRVAIVGDVSQAAATSTALRDFIRESNRGRHVWFVPDLEALSTRLAQS